MVHKAKPYWVYRSDEVNFMMPVSHTLADARKQASSARKDGADRVVILKYVEEKS